MSVVIGRSPELAHISRLCAADHESALLVLGAPGMGKTQLLKAAHETNTIESAILHVNPSETVWPFAGLSLLLSLIDNIRMSDVLPIDSGAPHSSSMLFDTAGRVLDAVRSCSLAPQLVLIDDFDRMDAPSRRVISFMASRLRGTGLRLIIAATELDPALTFGPSITLSALSPSDSLLVAKHMAGQSADESTLTIVVDHSDGNPLAIRESIGSLTPDELRGVAPLRLPLPPSPVFRRASIHRISGLSRGKRALLDRLASAPLTTRSFATRGESLLEDLLEDLVASGLVTERGKNVQISSAMLRSHVYWSLSSQERRTLHASELAATEDAGLAAWHRSFSLSADTPARVLMDAAVSLARSNEMVAAIEFAERARSLMPSTRVELDGVTAFTAALFRHANLACAARYAEVGLRGSTTASARLTLAYLRLQIEFLRSLRVSDLDVDAWADLHATKNPDPTADLLTMASLCRASRWEIDPARQLLERANLLIADRALSGASKAEQLLLAVEGSTGTRSGLTRKEVANSSVVDLLVAARAALLREQYDEARHLCSVVLKLHQSEPIWVDTAQYTLAEVEVRAEQPFAARAEIARWRALPSSRSRPSFGAQLEAWLAHVENRPGDAVDLITSELDSPKHQHGPATRSFLYCLRGQVALVEDDIDTAIRMLGHADLIDRTFDNPGLVRHLPDLVEAHYRAGRLPELRQTLDRFDERRARHPSLWATRAAARIAAIVADDEHAISLFDRAIEQAMLSDAGIEAGRLHALRAARLARLDRPSESQRSYLAARDLFDEAGELAWARRMDERLATIAFESFPSEENAALSSLSSEERRIVKYVQLGLRNKEIALALYIAVRTVELRLTHIYRTVGVRSRSQLISTLRL